MTVLQNLFLHASFEIEFKTTVTTIHYSKMVAMKSAVLRRHLMWNSFSLSVIYLLYICHFKGYNFIKCSIYNYWNTFIHFHKTFINIFIIYIFNPDQLKIELGTVTDMHFLQKILNFKIFSPIIRKSVLTQKKKRCNKANVCVLTNFLNIKKWWNLIPEKIRD